MNRTANASRAEALVREGWNHLKAQRPAAAWASWRRALGLDPESRAAAEALATLESVPELPASARKPRRLRPPRTAERRARWDARLGAFAADADGDGAAAPLDDLDAAADAFEALHDEDPDDADAWFDHALCLAWAGRNRAAVDCLERAVALEAETDPEAAVAAWTFAETLRQGAGAEDLADDLRYACRFAWRPESTPALLAAFPELRRLPTPRDPARPEADARLAEIEVFEWLDRPFPADLDPDADPDAEAEADADVSADRLPRALATVYLSGASIRLSSPWVDGLEQAEERLRLLIGDEAEPLERSAAPLPLPFLDAAAWTVRLPRGRDRAAADRWTREAVEAYYEDRWIHRPRQALDGLSPLAAGRSARSGDDAIRARLLAVVAFREELGARPSAAALYQGYPFDRLRRRLGLEPVDPDAVEPGDLSCAGAAELEALDPDELDGPALVEAFASAAGLRDDRAAARFAAAVLGRTPGGLGRVDPTALAACLVRAETAAGRFDAALRRLDQARALAGRPADRRTLDVWRAEVLVRADRGDEAAAVYRALLDAEPVADDAGRARTALDAAETLVDAGRPDLAPEFLRHAVTRADAAGLEGAARRARRLLDAS